MTPDIQRLLHDIVLVKIGDVVRFRKDYRYYADWPGEYIVTGMNWEYQRGGGFVSIAIATEDDIIHGLGSTDGFSTMDIEVL